MSDFSRTSEGGVGKMMIEGGFRFCYLFCPVRQPDVRLVGYWRSGARLPQSVATKMMSC